MTDARFVRGITKREGKKGRHVQETEPPQDGPGVEGISDGGAEVVFGLHEMRLMPQSHTESTSGVIFLIRPTKL